MNRAFVYKPFQFFFIVELITWTCLLVLAWFSYRPGGGQQDLWFALFAVVAFLAPFMAAMWFIFTSKNAGLKQNFRDKLLNPKLIRPWTIPLILFLLPAAMAISILLSCLLGQSPDQFRLSLSSFSTGMIPVPVMLFGAACFEELGWRGYGVDSLRSRYNYFTATVVFALLWALWHCPLFFVNDWYQNILWKTSPLFALNFFVSIIPFAFIINWLWYKNRGSIITAILAHVTINAQGIIQMSQVAKCIESGVLIVIAVILVWSDRQIFFGKPSVTVGDFGE
jgi:uncharacterized protein